MTKIKNKLSSTQIICFSFLIIIFIGSILLKLPIASTNKISYLEALFTATSATCVTGHTIIDIESLTLFGKIVVMLLIQIGGLGFILVMALIFMTIGKKLTFKNRMIISEFINKNDFNDIFKLLRRIIKYTLTFELFGALIIATRLVPELRMGKWFI